MIRRALNISPRTWCVQVGSPSVPHGAVPEAGVHDVETSNRWSSGSCRHARASGRFRGQAARSVPANHSQGLDPAFLLMLIPLVAASLILIWPGRPTRDDVAAASESETTGSPVAHARRREAMHDKCGHSPLTTPLGRPAHGEAPIRHLVRCCSRVCDVGHDRRPCLAQRDPPVEKGPSRPLVSRPGPEGGLHQ